jgi:predicted DCC family thiol-disulfide oxidoreductase YuxK
MSRAVVLPLVIFDGKCVLCVGGVKWMLERDNGKVMYGAIQQGSAKALYEKHGLDWEKFDTFMVLDAEGAHLRWKGVLAAARLMKFPYNVLGGIGKVVPSVVGDYLYDVLQRHRLAWFGVRDSCYVPSRSDRERFLHD